MSYDIIIEAKGRSASADEIHDVIKRCLGIVPGEILYPGEDNSAYVGVDLEKDGQGRVVRVEIHLPHAVRRFASEDHPSRKPCVDLALALAEATGWRPFDPQLDVWLDEETHPWRRQHVPAGARIDWMEWRDGDLHLHAASGRVRLTASARGVEAVTGVERAYEPTVRHGELAASYKGVFRGGVQLWTFDFREHNACGFTFSPDGSRLATADPKRREVRIWDTNTGAVLQTLKRCGEVWVLAWSPNGSHLLTGPCRPTARIWSESGESRCLLKSPGRPLIWDEVTSEWLPNAKDQAQVTAAAWADPRVVFVAFSGGALIRFDLDTEKWTARATGIAGIAADGRWVVRYGDSFDASPGLSAFQWQWFTDARLYREVIELDEKQRSPGLLARFFDVS